MSIPPKFGETRGEKLKIGQSLLREMVYTTETLLRKDNLQVKPFLGVTVTLKTLLVTAKKD
jgi:hypothetical protein